MRKIRISVQVVPNHHEQLKKISQYTGKKKTEIIREGIEAIIKKYELDKITSEVLN